MIKPLCIARARYQLLMAKTASSVWTSLILKRWDAVLTKVRDFIFFKSFMDLCNSSLSGPSELFPAEVVENFLYILHNEAIRKAVSAKKLYFSQFTRPQQPAKCPSLTTSGKSSGCPSSSGYSSGPKASSSASRRSKGKKF